MTLITPHGGELIVVADAEIEVLAQAYDEIADAEQELRAFKRELHDEISQRLDFEGRRTISIPNFKIETNAPTEKVWNLDELRGTLAELVAEGTISDDKAKSCVRYEPKAVWVSLKTLLSDPRCAARIAHCMTEQPAQRYAKVKRV